jgi:hypothetical protein
MALRAMVEDIAAEAFANFPELRACELRRLPFLRTRVNRIKEEGL